MPLAGGTTVPTASAATLPNNLFVAQRTVSPGALQRRQVDGSGKPVQGTVPTTVNTALDWSTVRGAFLLNGTLFYGSTDRALHARTFDKSTGSVGPQQTVNLYDDPESGTRIPWTIASVTGMFYDPATHRIYYTVFGNSRLFYRYFTPESKVVGAQTFEADNGGVDFGSVAGMTLADGKILFGSSADGSLRTVTFTGGRVTGTPSVASTDGSWKYRAIFVPNN